MEPTLEFSISADVFETFPDIHILALRASIDDQTSLKPACDQLLADMPQAVEDLRDVDPLTSLPEIACWRDAYGKIGVKPSKYPSSIEALLRRVKKGDLGETGIPAVDLYNRISVKHRVPLGAYDARKLRQTEALSVRHAAPDEDHFTPLGGRPESFPLNPALIVYAQASEILCWGFNTRDCASRAVDTASSEILFFSETTSMEGSQRARAALSDLATMIQDHGGFTADIATFSSHHASGRV